MPEVLGYAARQAIVGVRGERTRLRRVARHGPGAVRLLRRSPRGRQLPHELTANDNGYTPQLRLESDGFSHRYNRHHGDGNLGDG
jgi:hypothetical protein